ncbi:sensor domain-containing diguanylate cyclase [Aestuariirhabdus litorea]|uniref:diguanylate cyclase n=1 Tax=Aestuariirhabdus litorea TaxID=2528527 RepID=A0A3P3VIS4_9GAMM|nr:diguanylate cyclase [Aestuariirhabdus litorea]RRJ82257.1 GGDEF domain-containing protein [Aestuariirhabdus litorea]RWW92424.1 diguanylate cyclase [Endozoicomonadaceae bacterium GTF-13]
MGWGGSLFFALMLLAAPAGAATLDLTAGVEEPIGRYLHSLAEPGAPLSPQEALAALEGGQFSASQREVLGFGIGAGGHWLGAELQNSTLFPVRKRLSVEAAWLDRVEFYLFYEGRLVASNQTGDRAPFAERGNNHRFFVLDHDFVPGQTTLLIRVETSDPMVLPVYLRDQDAAAEASLFEGYSYGFLYGAVGSLLAYNLMLFVGLRDNRYLYYALYLSAFLAMNLAYTGHAYLWGWPDSPVWQQWANPLLMMGYILSGWLFASRFLDLKQSFPRVYRGMHAFVLLLCMLMLLAVAFDNRTWALWVAFFLVVLFPFSMVWLGALSLRSGNRSAKFFLLGSLSAAGGASVTGLAVLGVIPYNSLTFRAIDIGMLFDVVLLAMALADRFRITQDAKVKAETLARVDPLTGLNNRRAFYELVAPLWSSAQRSRRPLCVLLLDVDGFKAINDLHGHTAGDEVLVQVAHTLRKGLRSSDIASRWGGEEFIALLPDTALEEAARVAERIRCRIETMAVEVGSEAFACTASIGIAVSDVAGGRLEELIGKADEQLYLAKQQGKNRVRYLRVESAAEAVGA